jgi:hypothetical protein
MLEDASSTPRPSHNRLIGLGSEHQFDEFVGAIDVWVRRDRCEEEAGSSPSSNTETAIAKLSRNRGSVSVVDPRTDKVTATWTIPGDGSPDMGNVSADGTKLWLSGRFDSVVYVFDTAMGALLKKIPVSPQPHGLAVWPQPGRYSLGHTGDMR